MKEMSPRPFSLKGWQTERLSSYCTLYRRCLMQGQSPSVRRNQTLRATQAVQARLLQWIGGSAEEEHTLLFSQQEAHTLRQVVVGLVRQQRTTRPCEQRSAFIAELADVLLMLQRSGFSVERRAQV